MPQGFMIAAPRSGSGKTTVTLGLLRAMARRGLKVASFKCGPDYIDPVFHRVATGRTSLNLDSWTMPEDVLETNYARGVAGADMVVAEGSMGLFDGVAASGASGDGSSSGIAARFGFPVILVMDVSGQSQSAGAVALGFRDFDPDIHIAGVVLANAASERHRLLAVRGVERAGIPVLGALPRGELPLIPERHLGLVQADEIPDVSARSDALADAMETYLDIDAVMACARPLRPPHDTVAEAIATPGKRIAMASDVAFSFAYPHVLAGWRAAGADIIPFSPLADEAPDGRADICWLPGGYPELHAERLAGNQHFMHGLRQFAATRPVHGECGGYMVLGDQIIDATGVAWPMAGLLPLTTSFATRKLHLGYRAVRLAGDTPIGRAGQLLRGHEFHYATIVGQGEAQKLGDATDASGHALGPVGQRSGHVTGSFFHAVACDGKI